MKNIEDCYCPKCKKKANIPEKELDKKPKALMYAYCFRCNIRFGIYGIDFIQENK